MIKAIIFDCFGVLYKDAGQIFYKNNISNLDQISDKLQIIDDQFDIGDIDVATHAKKVAELTGLEADFIQQNIRSAKDRNDELVDTLKNLAKDYKIGMLSNIGHGGMEAFFDQAERERLFDAVVLSSEVAVIKPDAKIFEIMASQLGIEPSQCLMIDDRQPNCDGAKQAGMETILHEQNAETIRQIECLNKNA